MCYVFQIGITILIEENLLNMERNDIEMVPDLSYFDKIFQLYDGVKAIGIQSKPHFKFWILIFSRLAICSMILSQDAGQKQWAAAPSQITRAN